MKWVRCGLVALVAALATTLASGTGASDGSGDPRFERIRAVFADISAEIGQEGEVAPALGDCRIEPVADTPSCTLFWRSSTLKISDAAGQGYLSVIAPVTLKDTVGGEARTRETIQLFALAFLVTSNSGDARAERFLTQVLRSIDPASPPRTSERFDLGPDNVQVAYFRGGYALVSATRH